MEIFDSTAHRPVAELADAADLKSAELTLIRVQVPAGLFLFTVRNAMRDSMREIIGLCQAN